jgi:hypothetical protein
MYFFLAVKNNTWLFRITLKEMSPWRFLETAKETPIFLGGLLQPPRNMCFLESSVAPPRKMSFPWRFDSGT